MANINFPLLPSSQPQQQANYRQYVASSSLISTSSQHQQIQPNNAYGLPGYQNIQNIHLTPDMLRLRQMKMLQKLDQYTQMQPTLRNFSAGNATLSKSLPQNNQQHQQTRSLDSAGGVNISRNAMVGQNGHPMLSGSSQFNMRYQRMAPSSKQKAGLVQGNQLHQRNSTIQELQGFQTMASLDMSSQLRPNGSLAFAQSAHRMNPAQLRQQNSLLPNRQLAQRNSLLLDRQLEQQNSHISNQMQNMRKQVSLAFVDSQLTELPQNVQSALSQNTLSQWLKPMPLMPQNATTSIRAHQQRQMQAPSNQQIHQNSSFLNSHMPQQNQQQLLRPQHQFQQPSLHQQQFRIMVHGGKKHISLTGSQPDTTGSSNSSQGTMARNQLLRKRKIQNLVSKEDSNAKLDRNVEDLLLEFADALKDSGTQQQFQQPSLHQKQQPARVMVHGEQKPISLTGSQPDATDSRSSILGTNAIDQLLKKRKIQVLEVDSSAKLDSDIEDLLLEFSEFKDSLTQQKFQEPSLPELQQPAPVVVHEGQKPISLTGSQSYATGAGSLSQGTETTKPLLKKRKIQDLASEVDSNAKLDPKVENLLLELADEFIDSVTTFGCNLAKNRKSNTLECQDLILHLQRTWKLNIPGYSSGENIFKN